MPAINPKVGQLLSCKLKLDIYCERYNKYQAEKGDFFIVLNIVDFWEIKSTHFTTNKQIHIQIGLF